MARIKNWEKLGFGIWRNTFLKEKTTLWLGSNHYVNLTKGKFYTMPLSYDNRRILGKFKTDKKAYDFAIKYMRSHIAG